MEKISNLPKLRTIFVDKKTGSNYLKVIGIKHIPSMLGDFTGVSLAVVDEAGISYSMKKKYMTFRSLKSRYTLLDKGE